VNVTSGRDAVQALGQVIMLALNSLSGISVNVTADYYYYFVVLPGMLSQFPFWDFGECNPDPGLSVKPMDPGPSTLSIPFVGFR
jgi:hypothetical protein